MRYGTSNQHSSNSSASRRAVQTDRISQYVLPVALAGALFFFPMTAQADILDEKFLALAAISAIDYDQSVELFFGRDGYYELNPLLGKDPDRASLAAFGVVGLALVAALKDSAPDWVMDSIIATERWNVQENARAMAQGRRLFDAIPVILSFSF